MFYEIFACVYIPAILNVFNNIASKFLAFTLLKDILCWVFDYGVILPLKDYV